MIQLSALRVKGMNTEGKSLVQATGKSTAFDDLLQQISGVGEEKQEVERLMDANLVLITLPIEQQPLETASVTANEATLKIQSKNDFSNFTVLDQNGEAILFGQDEQRVVKDIEPMVVLVPQESGQIIGNQSKKTDSVKMDGEKLSAIQIHPSVVPVLQENPQEDSQQTDLFDKALLNNLDGKEPPQMPGIQSVNPETSLNSFHKIDSTGRIMVEMPVRAEHFAKDITRALSTAIDVQQVSDRIEATFSLKPEHLGKVDVKVLIHDGNVTAEFFTSTHLGKDLLETQVQALRTALEQQGFQVSKIDISQQPINFSGPFSQKGDSHGRHGQQESKKRNPQAIYIQEEEYQDYTMESTLVSQINTTA